jgi:hypothetical protein
MQFEVGPIQYVEDTESVDPALNLHILDSTNSVESGARNETIQSVYIYIYICILYIHVYTFIYIYIYYI